jgi:hypothetical protein
VGDLDRDAIRAKAEPETKAPTDAELRAQAAECGIRLPLTRTEQIKAKHRGEMLRLLNSP